jgi:hypothetical protein
MLGASKEEGRFMELATVLTIPTIVHLMTADDTPFPEHNDEVKKTAERFPQLLSLADHEGSANAIWKPEGLQFRLDRTDTVRYRLKDVGLTDQRDDQIPLSCTPTSEHDQRTFRAIQEKFGIGGFRGLQIFIWARIANAGGCAMSHPDGTLGSVWIEAPGVMDQVGFRLMAHEIGHFLTLPHVGPSTRLMNPGFQGADLHPDEIAQAKAQARVVMNQ